MQSMLSMTRDELIDSRQNMLTIRLTPVSDRPVFAKPFYEIVVLEGDSSEENLTARTNPSPVRYSWQRQGRPTAASLPWQPAGSPLLTLSRVSRQQAGWYLLTAGNSQGNTSVRVRVNVQCKPTARYYTTSIAMIIDLIMFRKHTPVTLMMVDKPWPCNHSH